MRAWSSQRRHKYTDPLPVARGAANYQRTQVDDTALTIGFLVILLRELLAAADTAFVRTCPILE